MPARIAASGVSSIAASRSVISRSMNSPSSASDWSSVGADLVSIWPDVTVALRIGMIPPMPAWPASQVTVIGDAVHLVPGFGGNLAMRDAHHLRAALVDAYRGRLDLLDAIGAYENTMRRNSFTSVAVKAGA